jgi:carboxyl-terminal processing protease
VRGEIGSSVEITFIRGEEFVTVTAIRAEVEEILVDYTIDYEENLGYVRIVSFKENTINQFVKAIDELEKQNVRGIVFDLRTNPGGYVQSVCDVISYLIPSGKTIVSYQYKGRENVVRKSTDDAFGVDHVVDLPFVVICDGYTASSGEIFTSAIRDYRDEGMIRATIVGTTTYKKGIMQNTYYYLDDSTVTVTVAYYNPPCGVNYHGIGITPDVIVENTAEEDLQLKTAFAELIKLINAN